jgi:hypothetical protein
MSTVEKKEVIRFIRDTFQIILSNSSKSRKMHLPVEE